MLPCTISGSSSNLITVGGAAEVTVPESLATSNVSSNGVMAMPNTIRKDTTAPNQAKIFFPNKKPTFP